MALKFRIFPEASLLTSVFPVAAVVALFANMVAVPIAAAVDPPTVATVGKADVPPRSFVNIRIPFTVEVASVLPPGVYHAPSPLK